MTPDEFSALLDSVKRCHWDAELGVKMFLKRHPHIKPSPELYGYAVGVGRTPFPNIKGLPEGPFPVYIDRPWNDVRMWQSPEQKAWEKEMREL